MLSVGSPSSPYPSDSYLLQQHGLQWNLQHLCIYVWWAHPIIMVVHLGVFVLPNWWSMHTQQEALSWKPCHARLLECVVLHLISTTCVSDRILLSIPNWCDITFLSLEAPFSVCFLFDMCVCGGGKVQHRSRTASFRPTHGLGGVVNKVPHIQEIHHHRVSPLRNLFAAPQLWKMSIEYTR